jgi:LPPG:FO 2-phospho-L-lactate transferase
MVVADEAGQRMTLHFQEWWVRHHGELPAQRFVFVGADVAAVCSTGGAASAFVAFLVLSLLVVFFVAMMFLPEIRIR